MIEAVHEDKNITILQEIDNAALHRKARDILALCFVAASMVVAGTWNVDINTLTTTKRHVKVPVVSNNLGPCEFLFETVSDHCSIFGPHSTMVRDPERVTSTAGPATKNRYWRGLSEHHFFNNCDHNRRKSRRLSAHVSWEHCRQQLLVQNLIQSVVGNFRRLLDACCLSKEGKCLV